MGNPKCYDKDLWDIIKEMLTEMNKMADRIAALEKEKHHEKDKL